VENPGSPLAKGAGVTEAQDGRSVDAPTKPWGRAQVTRGSASDWPGAHTSGRKRPIVTEISAGMQERRGHWAAPFFCRAGADTICSALSLGTS